MNRKLYALLVGIDDYPTTVPRLAGCVNDITAITDYLRTRVDSSQHGNIKTLLNAEATRQEVIKGFEQHLTQAGEGDVVLFYYSGHGSQETAAPEFLELERDGKLETLVCWDSRTSARDLANKELRCLIAKVAERNPHIVIVLDCCHAGSGTRNTEQTQNVRHAPADERPRKPEEFISEVTSYLQGTRSAGGLPEGQHVLLAACADREVASEYPNEGKARGAFSCFLLNALNKSNGVLSYRELFREVSSRVRSQIKDQTPRLEATYPDDLDNLPFLGGSEIIKPREPFYTLSHDGTAWTIDGGAIHGLPRTSSIPVKLALYPQTSTSEQLRQLAEAVGEVEVVEVLPDRSVVEFTQEPTDLTDETVLKAVIIALPLPSIGVYLDGESEALDRVRQQLQKIGSGEKPSLYVREEGELTKAQYRLLAKDGRYMITKPSSDRPLVAPLQGYDKAFRAVKNLEHIARWTTTIDLANPESQLPANAVKLQIYRNGKEVKDSHLRLEYEHRNGKWQEPTFQVKLTNTHNQPLFCAILDVAEDYSVSVPPFFPQGETSQTGGVWIQPEEKVWAATYRGNRKISDTISAGIPDEFLKQGITEYQDVLKLIVSTAEFDANLLCQVELSSRQVEVGSTTRSLPSQLNSLNMLMAQIQSRQVGASKLSNLDDWVTSQVSLTTVRPQDAVRLNSQAAAILTAGVTIQPHSGLQASARLATVPPSTRDIGGATLPPILDDYTQPFQFTASRGVAPGLSVLELQVDEGKTIGAVTPEDPLVLSVNQSLAANEYILPVAHDGEFWLPLGQGNGKDGKIEIRIDRLPALNQQLAGEKTRSLGGAIRIYFQKLIYHNLGHESPYPKLRVARMAEDGTVHYAEDKQQIKVAVANAQRIVLYIHGIIGDTESMVPSVRHAKVQVSGQPKSIAEIYDLVLTFDYESLNTPIKELGKQLKDKLAAIGLQPNHGKTLHIVAHSMGGLVSRSFIEQWGGNRVVQHLIMLGTPNAGSPWAAVQDMATFALAAGLNGLSSVVFPVKVLGELVKLIEKIDINLDEMHPTKSQFLQELKDCADPQCPYSIIAGNTSLIPQQEALNRLQAALQRTLHRAIDLPFLQEAHDIAVTVKSIVSVPEGRLPAAYIQDQIACDHLSYFRHPVGLEALAKAVGRAFADPFDLKTSPQKPQPRNPQPGTLPNKPSAGQTSSRSQSNLSGTSTTQANLQSATKMTERSPVNPPKNASAYNGKVNVSSQAVENSAQPKPDRPKRETGFENSYAVVIGINNYQSGIQKLQTAVNDAREIAEILERNHGYTLISPPKPVDREQNKAWMDGDATLKNLEDLFKDLKGRVGEKDRLLFYFAGHGNYSAEDGKGPQGYLIPQDAEDGEKDTYLSMNKLRNSLLELNCRHCLLVLDCCHAGSFGFTDKRQVGIQQKIYKETLDWYRNKAAWQVITSTDPKQEANDGRVQFNPKDGLASDKEHSPFAFRFIDALKTTASDIHPTDGIVTARELWVYLSSFVEEETRSRLTPTNDRNLQNPKLYTFDERHEGVQYIFFTSDFNENELDDAPDVDEKNNPYRGEEPYTEEHSDKFFGRQAVINQLCDRVCDRPFTILLGESGSGKTSLIQAGLIPHLKRSPEQEKSLQSVRASSQNINPHTHKHQHWQILPVIQPGDTPVKNLEDVLNSICKELSDDTKILLVIDQCEQLVQRRSEEQDKFWQRLLTGLNEHSNQLHLVLVMRSDFETQLQSRFTDQLKQQATQELNWKQARYDLPVMTEEDIKEAIERPASEVAVRFETEPRNRVTLAKRLVNEVKDSMPGALPWLSIALRKLYDKIAQRFREAAVGSGEMPDREIKWQDYDELRDGKNELVSALILIKANEVYESLLNKNSDKKDAFARTVRNLMLRMITVEGDEITSRKAVKSELEYADSSENDRVKQVINRFVDERLLVKGSILDPSQPANTSKRQRVEYVKPVHDSLIHQWSLVQTWIKEKIDLPSSKPFWKIINASRTPQSKVDLLLRKELTEAVRKWQISGDVLLWGGSPHLKQLKEVSKSDDNWLSKLEAELVKASVGRRRVIWIGLSLLAVILAATVGLPLWRNAEIRWIESKQESAQRNLTSNQEMDALVDAIHAGKKLNKSLLLKWKFQPALVLRNQVTNTLQKAFYQVREKNLLKVDGSEISQIAFSPDGQYIVTVQPDGIARLWERSGKQLSNFAPFDVTEGEQFLQSIRFSSDGQHLVTSITDVNDEQSKTIVNQWNFQGEKQVLSLPNPNQETVEGQKHDVFSSDGKVIMSASKLSDGAPSPSNDVIAFKDASSGKELGRIEQKLLLPGWRARLIVDCSSVSQLVATVSQYRERNDFITLWDLQGNRLAYFPANQGGIEDIRFSSDGTRLASIGYDGTVRLWQNLQGKPVAEFPAGPVIQMSLSSDGRLLAIARQDGTVELWDWQTQQGRQILIALQETDSSQVVGLNFSADNRLLVISKAKGEIYQWNVENLENLHEHAPLIQGSEVSGGSGNAPQRGLSLSQDGRWMATGGIEVTVYNQAVRAMTVSLPKESEGDAAKAYPFLSTAFSSDGSLLAVGDIDGQIYLQNLNELQNGQNKPEGPFHSEVDRILSLSFSPKGNILAVAGTRGSNGVVRLWDVQKKALIGAEIKGHRDWIKQVIFSSDGTRLATAGADGTARVWDLSGQELAQFGGFNEVVSLAFSPDGKQLIAAGRTGGREDNPFGNLGQVKQWQLEDLDQLLARSCDWARDYLSNQANADDRHLCDGIPAPAASETTSVDQPISTTAANSSQQAGVAQNRVQSQPQNAPSPTPTPINRQNTYPQAHQDYKRSIAINAASVEVYINQGMTYYQQGNYEQAINSYTNAIARNPNNPKAYNNRGLAYTRQGNYPKAIADHTKAISLNPIDVDAYINRGVAYYQQGNYQQAIANYNKAINLDPGSAIAHSNRGLAYDRLGLKTDKAGQKKSSP